MSRSVLPRLARMPANTVVADTRTSAARVSSAAVAAGWDPPGDQPDHQQQHGRREQAVPEVLMKEARRGAAGEKPTGQCRLSQHAGGDEAGTHTSQLV